MKTIKNFLFKKRIKILKSEKGFSLIELMVTVGIMGVLVGVGIPAYNGYQSDAAEKAAQADSGALLKALQACLVSSTATACATATVNDTISLTCGAAGTAKPTTEGCFFKLDGTTKACYGTFKKGGGLEKHACFQYTFGTHKITTPITVGKFCKSDGTCANA